MGFGVNRSLEYDKPPNGWAPRSPSSARAWRVLFRLTRKRTHLFYHDQRESGSERPFSFASFLFLRGISPTRAKKKNSNRPRGSSRCGIRPAACSLHRNEGATGFLRLACAAGSAVARGADAAHERKRAIGPWTRRPSTQRKSREKPGRKPPEGVDVL